MIWRQADNVVFQTYAGLGSIATAAASVVSDDWSLVIFGVPFPVLIAAFAGALSALSFLPKLERWYVVLASSTALAAYTTPLWIALFPAFGVAEGRPVAALLGLLAQFGTSLFFRDGREIILGWLRAKLGIKESAP